MLIWLVLREEPLVHFARFLDFANVHSVLAGFDGLSCTDSSENCVQYQAIARELSATAR